jgi:serine/threonine protein phosphatase PrpC
MKESVRETVKITAGSSFSDAFFASPGDMMPVSFGATTDIGRVRQKNEDHYGIFQLRRNLDLLWSSLVSEPTPIHEAFSFAMVVADGMGGMKSGEVASRLALQTMAELAGQATSWVMKFTDVNAQQIEKRVQAYVQRIQSALQHESQTDKEKQNMGTTWTSAHLLGHCALIVHCGDSRAYHYRAGILRQITHDDTLAQSLIDFGVEPAKVERFRHVLLNSFGGGSQSVRVAIHVVHLAPNDQLLLCSDGLTEMVPDSDIAAELSVNAAPQSTCDALVQRALARGGRDNVTVLICAMNEGSGHMHTG